MMRTLALIAATAMLGACAAPVTKIAAGSSDAIDREAKFQRELAFQQYADDLVRTGGSINVFGLQRRTSAARTLPASLA